MGRVAEQEESGPAEPAAAGALVAAAEAPDPKSKPKKRPGNPYFCLQNLKLETAKRFCGDRPMSSDEKKSVYAAARKEWTTLQDTKDESGESGVEIWKRLNIVKHGAAASSAAGDGTAADGSSPKKQFVGLWGSSRNPQTPLSISDLVSHGVGKPKPQGLPQRNDCNVELSYQDVEVERTSHIRGESALAQCIGCFAQKKNICRVHGRWSGDAAHELDTLTGRLARWTDSLGATAAKTCECILWLHAQHTVEGPLAIGVEEREIKHYDMLVLLLHPTYSPKMQWYLRLTVENDPDPSGAMPPIPYVAIGALGPSRMGGRWVAQIQAWTSDEISAAALSVAREPEWSMRQLYWEDPLGTHASILLAFRILLAGPEIARKPVNKKVHVPYKVPADISEADAFQAPPSAKAAAAMKKHAKGKPDGVEAAGGENIDDEDLADLDDLPDDVVEELQKATLEAAVGPTEPMVEGDGRSDSEESGEEVGHPTDAVFTDVAHEDPVEYVAAPITAAEAASIATVSPEGYVKLDWPPWDEILVRGDSRIGPGTSHPRDNRRPSGEHCAHHVRS